MGTSRRTLLKSLGVGGWLGLSAMTGAGNYVDDDGDGIPDSGERADVTEKLDALYGDQFDGLDPERPDLLIDARYVQGTEISDHASGYLVELFRQNGIHAQWLEHPDRLDREHFEAEYGAQARSLLWSRGSYYRREVEPWLRDVAVQVVVVPGEPVPSGDGDDASTFQPRVYSHQIDAMGGGVDGYVNGFSVGNRAVVAERDNPRREAELVLHELGHLALCHSDDPENTGVMGTSEEVDFTDGEWATFRQQLGRVRDRSGYDVVFRPCLWEETVRG